MPYYYHRNYSYYTNIHTVLLRLLMLLPPPCWPTCRADVETGFFARWWDEQTEAKKEITRGLVKSGQLEFINGTFMSIGGVRVSSMLLKAYPIPFPALHTTL